MKKHLLLGVAAVAIVAGAAFSVAGRAVAGGRQLLDLKYGALQAVFADVKPGDKGKTAYVLDYKLTNAGTEGVKPVLHFVLKTETDKTFADHYDASAFRAATRALGLKSDLTSTASIRAGTIEKGATADGLANFGAIDPNADDFQVRVYGLYDPVFRDKQGRTWSERRVLVLSYSRTGDEYDRQNDEIRLTSVKEELEGEIVRVHETN